MTDDAPCTILLVEDDPATRTFLADNLAADGYDPVVAGTLAEGRTLLETQFPDLVLVDVQLPDGSGLDLVRGLRAADGLTTRLDPRTPVMVLSGRGSELDRIRGLERGADDYVVKPFGYGEVRARVAALLRRAQERPSKGLLRVGSLLLDPSSREVRVGDVPVELSQKEFTLLRVLAAEPTRVFTKSELLRMIWGFRDATRTRTLDSHACRLRQKLTAAGGTWIVNVWGVGYRLVDAVELEEAA